MAPCCIPELHTGTLQEFPRVSVSIRCGRCFPLVMPFLWEFPPRAPDKELNCAAKLPCSATSALCPFRVARVSRLIGKSDTTYNRPGWQVPFPATSASNLSQSAQNGPQTYETPLPSEWRFVVLRWSLASQLAEDGGESTVPTTGSSGRFPPFEGPLLWR
jgi:hypothetical protein